MGDRLERLMDPGLSQAVMDGSRLAERVPRIPDDIVDGIAVSIGVQQLVDDRPSPMRPRRNERKRGHHAGNLRPQRGSLDPIGPPDIPCLHSKVQLEAYVRPRRPAIGGRAMPGPSIRPSLSSSASRG